MVTEMKHLMPYWKTLIVFLIPLCLSPLIIASDSKEARCGFVVLLMVIYWMIEAMPLAITSLLPVALFPLLGVMGTEKVSVTYLKEANMMFLGGLMIAIAVEHCNLHKRVALRVMMICGTTPKWLMFGFMMTTMFMSMWINNTAAAAMMMPIIEAVLEELFRNELATAEEGMVGLVGVVNPRMEMKSEEEKPREEVSKLIVNRQSVSAAPVLTHADVAERRLLRKLMMLSLAYSSNIGGTGTLTGTAPNLVLKGLVDQMYPGNHGLNFASWMVFAVPTMLSCCISAWLLLQIMHWWCRPKNCRTDRNDVVRHLIQNKYTEMGPMTCHEAGVLVLFVFLVTLWLFREPQFITGWAEFFPDVKIKDATAAILVVILLFIVPAEFPFPGFRQSTPQNPNKKSMAGKTLLEWNVVQQKLPWGILLLLGGGFALAEGSKESGLSKWVGLQLSTFEVMPSAVIVFIVCVISAVLTEVASNTATATIMLPILANLAQAVEIHPLYLMFPATITCSFAFMLPIATPPNAIVFSSGCMETKEMLLPGFIMKVVTMAITMLTISTIGTYVFDLNTFPDWAAAPNSTAGVVAAVANATTEAVQQLLTTATPL